MLKCQARGTVLRFDTILFLEFERDTEAKTSPGGLQNESGAHLTASCM